MIETFYQVNTKPNTTACMFFIVIQYSCCLLLISFFFWLDLNVWSQMHLSFHQNNNDDDPIFSLIKIYTNLRILVIIFATYNVHNTLIIWIINSVQEKYMH